jgi:hypothetical protein
MAGELHRSLKFVEKGKKGGVLQRGVKVDIF